MVARNTFVSYLYKSVVLPPTIRLFFIQTTDQNSHIPYQSPPRTTTQSPKTQLHRKSLPAQTVNMGSSKSSKSNKLGETTLHQGSSSESSSVRTSHDGNSNRFSDTITKTVDCTRVPVEENCMLHLQNRRLQDILTLPTYSLWSLGGDQQFEQEDWPDRQRPQPRQEIHRPLALEAMMGCLSRDNTPVAGVDLDSWSGH